jgi:hypothetical protein
MSRFTRTAEALLSEPLPAASAVAMGTALTLGTAAYCVAYTHFSGAREDALYAVFWAAANVLPWWIGFELSKRLLRGAPQSRGRTLAAVCAVLAATTLLSLSFERLGTALLGDASAGFQLVRRLPFLGLTAALLAMGSLLVARSSQRESSGAEAARSLPSPADIDWVRAAGNYVEVRSTGRIRTIRMTMERAEAALADHGFLRVHRSSLVKTANIVAYLRGKEADEVRLACGTLFRVGASYRASVSQSLAQALP